MNSYKQHQPSGLWIREDPFFGDEGVIKEQLPQYGRLSFQDQVVMDIGGDFGAFAKFALDRGAKQVISYEPFEESFDLFRRNHDGDDRVTPLNFAIMPEEGQADFYLSNHYPSCHTTLPVRGRDVISVPCLSFRHEMDTYQPTLLKMDIEGGEYRLLTEPLPEHVRQAAVEFHLRGKGSKEKILQVLETVFLDWYLINSIRFSWNITTPLMTREPVGRAIKDMLPQWKGTEVSALAT